MARPPDLWVTLSVRVPPGAEHIINLALARFYQGHQRPAGNPMAVGYMLEALSADFLAGPAAAHPQAGGWPEAASSAPASRARGGAAPVPAEGAS